MEKVIIIRFILLAIGLFISNVVITFYFVSHQVVERQMNIHQNGIAIAIKITNQQTPSNSVEDGTQQFIDFAPRPKRISRPVIYLTEDLRKSIGNQCYASHIVVCFDLLTTKYYICDHRILNPHMECPILYPSKNIQIIAMTESINLNITRDTTTCYLLWYNKCKSNHILPMLDEYILDEKEQPSTNDGFDGH